MTEYLTSGDAADWLSHNGMKNTLARSGVTTHVIRFIESESYANGLEGSDMKALAECTGGREFKIVKDDNLDNLYEELFKGIEIALDSDNDGIPDIYEDGLVLFNGCSIKLNKNNPDTDGDGESDATDPTPLRYQLNEELCKKICELNFMSREYIEEYVNLSSDINVKNGHIGKEWYDEWITFMFIRQFNSNYVGGNWDGTAGTIDYQFVEYVKNNDPDLFTFFESNSDYIASENGDMGDLYHLAATMSALIYESTFDDGRLFGLIPEKNIDSLAGWAGDLQTAMNDATIAVGDWADIDAINIKNMISRGDSLCESLNNYFSEGYKKRFTTFVDDKSRDSFIQETYVYTTEYFLGTRINGNIFGYEISSRWPLFEIKFFNKEWSMAASIAFTDYIFERMEDE